MRLDGQSGVLVRSPKNTSVKEPFQGPILPFGSLVAYHPISTKHQSRIHQFGKKVLPGLFLGYALYAVGIWKGDTMVADIRRWTNQTSWKRSRPENTHLDTGLSNPRRTSSRFPRRIRWVSTVTTIQDSFRDAGEKRNDFWSISGDFICGHHVDSRVKLCAPREESFPIPLKCIDVSRVTHTKCRKIASMIIGTSKDQGICLIFLENSHNLLY